MSQKAVERTYISALEEARKSWDLQLILEIWNRNSKRNRKNHYNVWNKSRLCDMCEVISAENTVHCMPCRKWINENSNAVIKGTNIFSTNI
jgi:hypothetical protein